VLKDRLSAYPPIRLSPFHVAVKSSFLALCIALSLFIIKKTFLNEVGDIGE
jgi:hypothetical protein